MGVKGLWRLLLPIGRRISIETLEGQILAVDASIWMTQFLKAMRDPDSGQVRPAAHIIGFFRRICKLRFHGIRPVFVFDGATPEIKRRELMARRKRRDQFVATHTQSQVQRLAKRLLLEQLRKSKQAKTLLDSDKNVKIKVGGNNNNKNNSDNNKSDNDSDNDDGAFIAGFTVPGSQNNKYSNDSMNSSRKKNTDTKEPDPNQVMDVENDDNTQFELKDGEVIVTNVVNSARMPAASQSNVRIDVDNDNDWDKPIGEVMDNYDFAEKDEDEDEANANKEETVEYDDVLWTSISRSKKQRKHRSNKKGELFDMERVLSLPAAERKDAVELAKKRHRMQSRSEFMPVAANAAEYSQVQLRNFLRSSKLNKDIHTMAKTAAKRDALQNQGEVMASDRTTRLIFEKETESPRSKRKRLPWKKRQESSSEDEAEETEEEEEEDDDDDESSSESEDGGFLSAKQRPTRARQLQSKQSSSSLSKQNKLQKLGRPKRDESEGDDYDDDDDEINGFFRDQSSKEVPHQNGYGFSHARKRRIIVDDDDDEDENDDEEGGGFITPLKSVAQLPISPQKKADVKESEESSDGDDDHSDEEEVGGGFIKVNKPQGKAVIPKGAKVLNVSSKTASTMAGSLFRSLGEEGVSEGGGFLRGQPIMQSDANLKPPANNEQEVVIVLDEESDCDSKEKEPNNKMKDQETHDQMLAAALQEEEDAQIAASLAGASGDLHEDNNIQNSTRSEARNLTTEQSDREKQPINNKSGENLSAMDLFGSMSSTQLVEGAESGTDDDIAWENGDEEADAVCVDSRATQELGNGEQEKNLATGMQTSEASRGPILGAEQHPEPFSFPKDRMRAESPKTTDAPVEESKDDSSDNVDWEDGEKDDGGYSEIDVVAGSSGRLQQYSPQRSNGQRALSIDDDDDDDNDENEDGEDEQVFGDTKKDREDANPGLGIDDFGTRIEADNAAALEQAEATASNLTNWAGRAVRLAIAEHLGAGSSERVESPRPKQGMKGSVVDEVVLVDKGESSDFNNKSVAVAKDNLTLNEENAEEAAAMMKEYEAELAEPTCSNVEREMETMTDEMQEEIMQLLQLFGVPYVQAPSEAEAQCVTLEKLGLVSGIVTEDSDVFVFGGKKVYKNIFDDQKYVEVYLSDDAEREMGLGHNEMVALAMLLGGDYTEGVKGVGIVNGMEIVTSFDVSQSLKKGLKDFRAWLDGFEPLIEAAARKDTDATSLTKEQEFHIKHRSARNRWNAPESFPSDAVMSAYLNPVVDSSTTKFSFGVPDMENLVAFCNKHAGWVPEDTRRLLEPVIERVESTTRQSRIDSFMRYEDGIKFANVRSKRLRDVLGSVQDETGKGNSKGKRKKAAKWSELIGKG